MKLKPKLEGQVIDKSKTKRKKDGVFYTPKYITKYIVENTVGKLCEDKKTELDITDENYQPSKQRSRKRLQNLQDYREWVLKITICDPACGSGAFFKPGIGLFL
jgi:type II restriction/modification system DNA methylase subunit YeeA